MKNHPGFGCIQYLIALFIWLPSQLTGQIIQTQVLYQTGFEASEGYDSRFTLWGQNGWIFDGSGDRLLYRVIEDEEEPKLLAVTDTGDIQIPYGGLVRAQGKTSKEFAKEVKSVLEKDLYYRATVIVALAEINKKRIIGKIYVAGNVRTPGSQDIPADETYTVGKAIIKAGGFTDFADKRKVRIMRSSGTLSGDKKTLSIDLTDIFEKGLINKDIPVEPEDMIYVPQRLVNW